jgi:hypothetical protein
MSQQNPNQNPNRDQQQQGNPKPGQQQQGSGQNPGQQGQQGSGQNPGQQGQQGGSARPIAIKTDSRTICNERSPAAPVGLFVFFHTEVPGLWRGLRSPKSPARLC